MCESISTELFFRDPSREYLRCNNCQLIFVPAHFFLSHEKEHARYDLHKNSPDESRYQSYLAAFADELNRIPLVQPSILDFGSGRHAVLTEILRQRGYFCAAYDPFYDVGSDAFSRTYDVVMICEVIEHLHDTRAEMARIRQALRPGGSMVIRTTMFSGTAVEFKSWYYKNDPTHIRFFGEKSIALLAELYSLKIVYIRDPVIILSDTFNARKSD